MSEHTALVLINNRIYEQFVVDDANKHLDGFVNIDKAICSVINADVGKRIVRACNHHEELVAMLKTFALCGFKREDGKTWAKCSPNDYDLEAAHALLAKIEGER